MEWTQYRLADGGVLSVLTNEHGVYAALDGEHLAGPMDPQHARVRVQVPLPDGRGNVGIRIDHTGAYVVDHDGRALTDENERNHRIAADAPDEVRSGIKALWFLAVVNIVLGIIAQAWPDWGVDAGVLWMVGVAFTGLAVWAMMAPRQAAIPFALTIVILIIDTIASLKAGYIGGVILRLFLVKWLYHGMRAALAAKRPTGSPSSTTSV